MLALADDLRNVSDAAKQVLLNQDVIRVDQDPKGKMALRVTPKGETEAPAPGNFYVNLPPLFLGHFSPIFPRFFPFFRRSLSQTPKIQETGAKTRKNGPKRSKNGRPKTPS